MDWRTAGKQYAEMVGFEAERRGHAPMEGRIIGWLLMCEPRHQSAGELAEALQASKSTISTSIRRLIQRGMVEKVASPGVRRSYYQLPLTTRPQLATDMLEGVRAMRQLADAGLEMVAWRSDEQNERLIFMRDFHSFLERELPALVARWAEEWRAGR